MQHSELQEQLAHYALGGLDAPDAARLAEHLDVCPACRALLSEYQFVAEELLNQVPAQTAPARVGVRIENLAVADAKRNPVPAAPSPAPRGGFWNQRLNIPRWGLAVVLIALMLLVTGGVLAFMRARPNTTVPDGVAQMLAARNLEFISLASAAGTPDKGTGFICLTRDGSTGLIWLYGLEPLDYDHVYQVWLKENGTRVSGGTFRSDHQGRAVAVINAPQPFNSYKEIGITVEPKAGSTAPTTERVIEGRLD